MHKGKKHSIKEGYEDFARSEGAEAKKYIDSVRTNNPFGEGLDDIMDEESRRRETGYYVKGTTISKGKKTDTPDFGTSRKSALNMLGVPSPLNKISGPCKAAAKKKFKVWPSAYASGWGVRCTKAGGPSKFGNKSKK